MIAPRFQPGRIVMTPGAVDLMKKARVVPSYILARHLTGDWGDFKDAEDRKANDRALNPKNPLRILSSYELYPDESVWVITEHDRSATTILLPSDY